MSIRRVAALSLSAVLLLAACSSGGGASTAPSAAASAPTASEPEPPARRAARPLPSCKVGVSWNNFKEERWAKWDEPSIKEVVEGAGGSYVGTDAGSSAEKQATDVEQLITDGAKVIIILAQDGTAIQPTVQAAVDQGIPVIAYDRLIENREGLLHHLRQPARRTADGRGDHQGRAQGQLRDHQGQQRRRELRLPARRASRRSSAHRSRPATSRSSARTTPTTGMPPSRRPPWSSSSLPRTTRSMQPSC